MIEAVLYVLAVAFALALTAVLALLAYLGGVLIYVVYMMFKG